MKNYRSIIFFAFTLLVSCNVKPEPINYGSDVCHNCSMTIVDKRHAAEYITKKGKVFKFDSIECMVSGLKAIDREEITSYLVADYGDSGILIDATRATFLVSQGVPSPMGGFLSAFGNEENAKLVRAEQGGKLLDWKEVQEQFKNER
jgi:copper chaperone NosL